jgi:hypothetical protein
MMTYAKTASRWSRRTAPIAASARRKMDADCTVEKYMTRSVRTVTRQTTVLIREIRFQVFPPSGRKMFVIVSRFDFFRFGVKRTDSTLSLLHFVSLGFPWVLLLPKLAHHIR